LQFVSPYGVCQKPWGRYSDFICGISMVQTWTKNVGVSSCLILMRWHLFIHPLTSSFLSCLILFNIDGNKFFMESFNEHLQYLTCLVGCNRFSLVRNLHVFAC
jgi:hypothetical protein